ncbi:hypothetical protein [Streptomyces sp. CL12]|uniref:hypothetical protein n=1 Tax=Streptomyces sp. CL12 TaxID=3391744 RepID=UPI003A806C69
MVDERGAAAGPGSRSSTTRPAAQCEKYRRQAPFSATTYCARAPMTGEASAAG